ncbi:MAG: hypothetical protein ACI9OD_003011 [Limisphaerales bacterium]|jgi:hypothetical protein
MPGCGRSLTRAWIAIALDRTGAEFLLAECRAGGSKDAPSTAIPRLVPRLPRPPIRVAPQFGDVDPFRFLGFGFTTWLTGAGWILLPPGFVHGLPPYSER